MSVDAEAIEQAAGLPRAEPDLEHIFRGNYARVVRVIARVVKDRARAEELAVEVFLRLWKRRLAADANVDGWLNRTAARMGIDELRRRSRRERYERLSRALRVANPEEIRAAGEEKERVRRVLARMNRAQAELLVLRGEGLSYAELAAALELNPASVGKLLSRAQAAFRKEYTRRYGNGR